MQRASRMWRRVAEMSGAGRSQAVAPVPPPPLPTIDPKDNGWYTFLEDALAGSAEEAQGYRIMHEKAHKHYGVISTRLTIPAIILSTLTGVANFGQGSLETYLGPNAPLFIGVLSIIAAVLNTIAKYVRADEKSETHRSAMVQWDKIHRLITTTLSQPRDRRAEAQRFLHAYRDERNRLTEQSPVIPYKVRAWFLSHYGDDYRSGTIQKPGILALIDVDVYRGRQKIDPPPPPQQQQQISQPTPSPAPPRRPRQFSDSAVKEEEVEEDDDDEYDGLPAAPVPAPTSLSAGPPPAMQPSLPPRTPAIPHAASSKLYYGLLGAAKKAKVEAGVRGVARGISAGGIAVRGTTDSTSDDEAARHYEMAGRRAELPRMTESRNSNLPLRCSPRLPDSPRLVSRPMSPLYMEGTGGSSLIREGEPGGGERGPEPGENRGTGRGEVQKKDSRTSPVPPKPLSEGTRRRGVNGVVPGYTSDELGSGSELGLWQSRGDTSATSNLHLRYPPRAQPPFALVIPGRQDPPLKVQVRPPQADGGAAGEATHTTDTPDNEVGNSVIPANEVGNSVIPANEVGNSVRSEGVPPIPLSFGGSIGKWSRTKSRRAATSRADTPASTPSASRGAGNTSSLLRASSSSPGSSVSAPSVSSEGVPSETALFITDTAIPGNGRPMSEAKWAEGTPSAAKVSFVEASTASALGGDAEGGAVGDTVTSPFGEASCCDLPTGETIMESDHETCSTKDSESDNEATNQPSCESSGAGSETGGAMSEGVSETGGGVSRIGFPADS